MSGEYLREFSKKFEKAVLVYSDVWGKLIHEKNRSQKSRDTVPLSMCFLHVRLWFSNCYVALLLKKLISKFWLVSMKLYTTVNSKTLGSNFEPE